MYLADYHSHSKYSFDGREEMADMCERAIKAGLSEIAITDHVDIYSGLGYGFMKDFDVDQDSGPYDFGTVGDPAFAGMEPEEDGHFRVQIPGGSMKMPFGKLCRMDMEGWRSELRDIQARYQGRLRVTAGAELGQPLVNPSEAESFLKDADLDFVIGSIHNMDYDLDLFYYDFQTLECTEVYRAYLDRLTELAEQGDFDVMGHITYPLKYMFEKNGIRMDLREFRDELKGLFSILEYSGKGIELNVSGLGRDFGETMPPMELLRLYRECRGEIICVGSDAHRLEQIGAEQLRARQMLIDAGFRYITLFRERKAEFIKI